MKIYFIGQKGLPAKSGGVEKHVEALAVNLAEKGHEVYVYTRPNYTDRRLTNYRGVNLISRISIPTKHLDAFSHTLFCSLDVLFRPADVIHFQAIGPASLLWLVKFFKPRTKVVFTFHCQDYYHQKWGGLAQKFLRFGEMIGCKLADEVIAVSRGLADYVARKYNREAKYIPNGVQVATEVKTTKILDELNLKSGQYILAVSRLVRHKGLHYLIEAYNKLELDQKLVIVGSGAHTDDYVEQVQQLATKNGRIVLAGERTGDDLVTLFKNAKLFVQPSESEGLSIALLEAMAYGIPVLVSDIPENLEAIGGFGQTFQSRSIDDLASKLKESLNLENSQLVAAQARERVKQEYDWQTITDNTIAVYKPSQA
jgi:glycosyltransferase involved in cell wall biosynthesis